MSEPTSTPKIQVTACDNELYILASNEKGSTELLHYKSGFDSPVDVSLWPADMLVTPGKYDLTFIGINWGGTSNFKVIVTQAGKPPEYYGESGSTAVGVAWQMTLPQIFVRR